MNTDDSYSAYLAVIVLAIFFVAFTFLIVYLEWSSEQTARVLDIMDKQMKPRRKKEQSLRLMLLKGTKALSSPMSSPRSSI